MKGKYVRCIVMENLKAEQLTEWNGFDVYDAETGEYLHPFEVAEKSFPSDKGLFELACGFCLTWEGFLYMMIDGASPVYIPRENKYLVQINGEKYMRW